MGRKGIEGVVSELGARTVAVNEPLSFPASLSGAPGKDCLDAR
ncbi:hypothetical protein HDG40_007893 [Paraburkholderia sp. JPY158]|uniref:Uncharacterized protein n=1 Tax=Paraburkholderia atlantica TaxID=2654982 RepID=A0A7W8QG79_PARAM|nr:hypothetical protein [Paraburkholderia atlantica]